MSTHTPGPWEARYHLLLEEKRKLASLETLTEKQKLNLGQINNDLDRWYALREAAPAMLEALKQIAALYDSAASSDGEIFLDESEIGQIAKAALAKAQGRG